MNEPKWTPGPWRVDGLWVVGANGALLVSGVHGTPYPREVQPNLELIAVAPDLHDATEEARALLCRCLAFVIAMNVGRSGKSVLEADIEAFADASAALLAKARGVA